MLRNVKNVDAKWNVNNRVKGHSSEYPPARKDGELDLGIKIQIPGLVIEPES